MCVVVDVVAAAVVAAAVVAAVVAVVYVSIYNYLHLSSSPSLPYVNKDGVFSSDSC